jgi:hypothetical protein
MRSLIIAALLLTPALASADEPTSRTPDATKMHADDCARARKAGRTCVLDMGGEEIESNAPTAGGSTIGAVSFGRHESLIRIRREFITEIIKTAEDLD